MGNQKKLVELNSSTHDISKIGNVLDLEKKNTFIFFGIYLHLTNFLKIYKQ